MSEGLYLLIRFPEGSEYSQDGAGGGAALGYRTDGDGLPGWISADGEEWIPFKGDFGFAVQPQFVPASEATVVMQGAHRNPEEQIPVVTQTILFHPAPNPFNPSTKLRFNLAQGCKVELTVYNLRGQVVKRLVDDYLATGPHEAVWLGRDQNGRSVASGVYFARMKAGPVVMTQRLTLVQ
jgi:hypothetical protein